MAKPERELHNNDELGHGELETKRDISSLCSAICGWLNMQDSDTVRSSRSRFISKESPSAQDIFFPSTLAKNALIGYRVDITRSFVKHILDSSVFQSEPIQLKPGQHL